MIKFYRTLSIRFKLIIAFLIMIIPILIVGLFSRYLSYHSTEEKLIISNTATIVQSAKLLEVLISSLKDEYINIYASSKIQDYLNYINNDEHLRTMSKEESILKNTANRYLTNITLSSSIISNIWIILETKKSLGTQLLPFDYSIEKLREQIWYNSLLNPKTKIQYYGFHPGLNGDDNEIAYAYSLIGNVKRITDNNFIDETVGVMILDFDLEYIYKILTEINLGNGGEIHLISPDGRDIYSRENIIIDNRIVEEHIAQSINVKNGSGEYIEGYNDEKYLIVFKKVGETGFTIAGLLPESEIISAAREINIITVYLIMFAVIVAVVLGFLFTFGIGKRITIYKNIMERVAGGNLEVSMPIDGNDELDILGIGFNNMIQDLRKYIDESVKNERIKRDMHINQLISQINPHMIYNTLNSVIYLAREDKSSEIIVMVKAFIQLLQDSIKIGDEGIYSTVEQEITSIKNYVIIQNYRYHDKFKLNWEFQNDVLKYQIPRSIIQPLVENSLFHGICPLNSPGIINISINKSENDLCIIVSDNGIGIEQGLLEQIYSIKRNDISDTNVKSIGLQNIKDRIEYLYNSHGSLHIESVPGEGTKVIVRIPLSISA